MIVVKFKEGIALGQSCALTPWESNEAWGWYHCQDPGLEHVRAGCYLQGSGYEFQVLDKFWTVNSSGPGGLGLLVRSLHDVDTGRELVLQVCSREWSLAWITLSDKGAAGERVDSSGPLIPELVGGRLNLGQTRGYVIPDNSYLLKSLLNHLALTSGVDLIFTTGGTGVAPRDITPDVTGEVLEKRMPGFEQAMTGASLQKTPHGGISRAAAGTLDRSLIINLPGSPKAVRENLEAVLPALEHALDKLQGDSGECAAG